MREEQWAEPPWARARLDRPAPLPAGFADSVMARIAAEQSAPSAGLGRWFALAALVVLTAVVVGSPDRSAASSPPSLKVFCSEASPFVAP